MKVISNTKTTYIIINCCVWRTHPISFWFLILLSHTTGMSHLKMATEAWVRVDCHQPPSARTGVFVNWEMARVTESDLSFRKFGRTLNSCGQPAVSMRIDSRARTIQEFALMGCCAAYICSYWLSGQHIGPIFKGRAIQDEWLPDSWIWDRYFVPKRR